MVPLAESAIYEMKQRGEFPRRFALSPRCVVWDLSEVEALPRGDPLRSPMRNIPTLRNGALGRWKCWVELQRSDPAAGPGWSRTAMLNLNSNKGSVLPGPLSRRRLLGQQVRRVDTQPAAVPQDAYQCPGPEGFLCLPSALWRADPVGGVYQAGRGGALSPPREEGRGFTTPRAPFL
jgi:hypothetical protein